MTQRLENPSEKIPENWTCCSIVRQSAILWTDCDAARAGFSAGVVIALSDISSRKQRLGITRTQRYDKKQFKVLLDRIQKASVQTEVFFSTDQLEDRFTQPEIKTLLEITAAQLNVEMGADLPGGNIENPYRRGMQYFISKMLRNPDEEGLGLSPVAVKYDALPDAMRTRFGQDLIAMVFARPFVQEIKD